jgi:hypothetical protein
LDEVVRGLCVCVLNLLGDGVHWVTPLLGPCLAGTGAVPTL